MAKDVRELASYYDEYYFLQRYDVSDEPYSRDNPVWQEFFGNVADRIVTQLRPRTVLDAGCGIGFLVEALRDRGVDAWGFDISEYAISQVREDVRPYCTVASVTDELDHDYDLIVCMELLEHLPAELAEAAVENLTSHADDILFSSTPDGFHEPSHLNVQPTDYWAALFARHGFYRDVDFDASFIAKHAIRFKRVREGPVPAIRAYERSHYRAAAEVHELRAANMAAVEERAELERQRARSEQLEMRMAQLDDEVEIWHRRAAAAEERLAEWEAFRGKSGWRIYVALAGARLRLAPLGTRRDRAVRAVFGGLARAFEWFGTDASRTATDERQEIASRPSVDALSLDEQYRIWLREHALDEKRRRDIERQAHLLAYRPLVSIVMPVYNTDPEWLRAAIDSVRGQLYEEWELCIADDASTRDETREVLREYVESDPRVRVTRLVENRGISAASNAALALATGEFVGLLDHDDELKPDALFEVVKLLNERPTLDYIYTDEDKRDLDGSLVSPFFKPDWSPDLILSGNYVTHFSVFRREVVDRVGGFRSEYDGSQDYDLVLRVSEATDAIGHVPKPLYTWRKAPGSAAAATDAKPFAYPAAEGALADALRRRNEEARVFTGISPGFYRVKYAVKGNPAVAIIIPTRDRLDVLARCVKSINDRSTFQNYEIILVDNESSDPATIDYLSAFQGQVVRCPGEFNFSRMVNAGAAAAGAELLLFLNNDTEVVSGEWIQAMVEHGQRPGVGAVGARLVYPDGHPQHEGIVIGAGGVAGNVDTRDYFGLGRCVRNCSAVTAACMVTRADVFHAVGGFDENLPVAFNDVDYCLKLRDKGYLVVYTPYAVLYHHEGESRGRMHPEHDERLCAERWRVADYRDPYYNPNLSLEHPFTLRINVAA